MFSIVTEIISDPADLSGGMQKRRLTMLLKCAEHIRWAWEGKRRGWVLERSRRVIKAGGEEVVESFSRLKGSWSGFGR